jgi:Zn-dependent protease with chaperone function
MNRALLLIAIPAFLVSIFWLTLGWGWRTATVVGFMELAIATGAVNYFSRKRPPRNPGCGGVLE